LPHKASEGRVFYACGGRIPLSGTGADGPPPRSSAASPVRLFKIKSRNKKGILKNNTEMIRKRDDENIIFLLGAGASADAGMPMVAQLTKELRKRLPDLPDVNGLCHPEYAQLLMSP